MNMTLLSPKVAALDQTFAIRASTVSRGRIVRSVNHHGHLVFTKYEDGSRKITFPQFRNDFSTSVEIVPVGSGRFGILRKGECQEIVPGRWVLSALADFRQSAAFHLEQWRAWEGTFA